MITSFASLQTTIADYLHRPNDTVLRAVIPGFIADAENRIANDLRVKAMEAAFSSAIAAGVVALPTGFLEWQFLYIDDSGAQKLTRKDAEWIYTNYTTRSGTGKPVFFAREGENVIFGPYPGSAYTVKGVYYKKLTALSAANPTNWFITNAPDLLLFAALAESAVYTMDDGRISLWESKYQSVKRRIEKTEKRENFSGSQLQISRG